MLPNGALEARRTTTLTVLPIAGCSAANDRVAMGWTTPVAAPRLPIDHEPVGSKRARQRGSGDGHRARREGQRAKRAALGGERVATFPSLLKGRKRTCQTPARDTLLPLASCAMARNRKPERGSARRSEKEWVQTGPTRTGNKGRMDLCQEMAKRGRESTTTRAALV